MIIGRELLTSLLGPCQHDASSGNPLVHEGAGWNVFQTHMYHRVLNLLGWEKKDHLDFALLTLFRASNTTGMNGNLIMYVSGQNKQRRNTDIIPSYQEVSISCSAYSTLAAYKTTEGSQDSIINTCIHSSMKSHLDLTGVTAPDVIQNLVKQRKHELEKLMKACHHIPLNMNGVQLISFVIVHYLVPNYKYFREAATERGTFKPFISIIFDTVCGRQPIVRLLDLIQDSALSNDELIQRLKQVVDSGIIELLSIEGTCFFDEVCTDLKNLKKKMIVENNITPEAQRLLQSQVLFQPQQLYLQNDDNSTHWNYHFCWNYWSHEKVGMFCSFLNKNLKQLSKTKSNSEEILSMLTKKINASLADTTNKDLNNSNATELSVVSVPKNKCNSNDNTSVPQAGKDKRDSNNSTDIKDLVVSVPNGGHGCNDNQSVSDHSSLTASTGSSSHKWAGNFMDHPSIPAKLSHHPISKHAKDPCVGNKSAIVSLDDTSSQHTKDDAPSGDTLFVFPLKSVTLQQLNEYACDLTVARCQIGSGSLSYIPDSPSCTPILKQDLISLTTGAMLSNRVILFFYNW